MIKNMGSIDKLIRIIAGILLMALYLTHTLVGTIGVIALTIGILNVAFSTIGWCPIYLPFGWSTCKTQN